MAKDFAKAFYSSKAWQDCRNSYAAKRLHLCERCLARGIYRPGDIVHHVIEITPELGDTMALMMRMTWPGNLEKMVIVWG